MARTQFRALLALAALVVGAPAARAAVSYEFCVTRVSSLRSETFGVRYTFPVADLGKEAARVVASQKFKEVGTSSVSVSDYDVARCGEIREETSFSATAEQAADLGRAIARGDLAGTAVAVLALGAGTTVGLVTGVGAAIGSATHWLGCRLGIGC